MCYTSTALWQSEKGIALFKGQQKVKQHRESQSNRLDAVALACGPAAWQADAKAPISLEWRARPRRTTVGSELLCNQISEALV